MDSDSPVKCSLCMSDETFESRFPLGGKFPNKDAVIVYCRRCKNMIYARCENSVKVEVKVKVAS